MPVDFLQPPRMCSATGVRAKIARWCYEFEHWHRLSGEGKGLEEYVAGFGFLLRWLGGL